MMATSLFANVKSERAATDPRVLLRTRNSTSDRVFFALNFCLVHDTPFDGVVQRNCPLRVTLSL
jgi:hypothetical protein